MELHLACPNMSYGKTRTVTSTCTNRGTQICTCRLNKANSGLAGLARLFKRATFAALISLSLSHMRLQFLFDCEPLLQPWPFRLLSKGLSNAWDWLHQFELHVVKVGVHMSVESSLFYTSHFFGGSLKTDIQDSNIETGSTSLMAAIHVTLWLLLATSWNNLHELEC